MHKKKRRGGKQRKIRFLFVGLCLLCFFILLGIALLSNPSSTTTSSTLSSTTSRKSLEQDEMRKHDIQVDRNKVKFVQAQQVHHPQDAVLRLGPGQGQISYAFQHSSKAHNNATSFVFVFVHGASRHQSAKNWLPFFDPLIRSFPGSSAFAISFQGHDDKSTAGVNTHLSKGRQLEAFIQSVVAPHQRIVLIARSAGVSAILAANSASKHLGRCEPGKGCLSQLAGMVWIAPATMIVPPSRQRAPHDYPNVPLLLVWAKTDSVVPFRRHVNVEQTWKELNQPLESYYPVLTENTHSPETIDQITFLSEVNQFIHRHVTLK